MGSILIHGLSYLITVDGDRRILRDGAVAIEDGTIVAVGKSEALQAHRKADRVIDGTDRVACPGFVNCHTHTPYYLVRGLADGLTLPSWLSEVVVPAQKTFSTEEARLSCLGTLAECLANGITTVADTGEGRVEEVPAAVEEVGIRAVVGKSIRDVESRDQARDRSADGSRARELVEEAESFHRRYHGGADGRITVWFSPSHERASSDQLLTLCKERADALGVGVETHVSASLTSVLRHKEVFGEPVIERFERLGILGPNLLIIHSNWLSDREVELVARHDVKVCHCPTSAVAGGFGTFSRGRFVELLESGATVALGSDNPAHSNFLDMLRTAYLAGVHRDVREDPSLLPPEKLLEMITIDGARALGLEKGIGSLEPGKRADLVLFDVCRPEWQPLHDPVSNLILSASGTSVDTVVVDGRVVVEKGGLTTLDQGQLLSRIAAAAAGIPERIGLRRAGPGWPVE